MILNSFGLVPSEIKSLPWTLRPQDSPLHLQSRLARLRHEAPGVSLPRPKFSLRRRRRPRQQRARGSPPNLSPAQLRQGIEARHPAEYYKLAAQLFETDATKKEAVSWFYVGQLRYRYYLAANPALPRAGDPAVFASLSEVIGRPINEYAGGKPDLWLATIDQALEWDASHDNTFTPKTKAPEEYRQIREGLAAMRAQLAAMKDKLPEMRRKHGLK